MSDQDNEGNEAGYGGVGPSGNSRSARDAAAENTNGASEGAPEGGWGSRGDGLSPSTTVDLDEAESAAALQEAQSQSNANGGFGVGGWSSGWSSYTQDQQASINNSIGRPASYNPDAPSLADRVFDRFNPAAGSKLSRLGIRGPGMTFNEVERQEAANPGMRDDRVALAGKYITGAIKSVMPGMGLVNAAITGVNVVNDLKNGAPLGDAMSRVVPGLIDSSINRATGGLMGKASALSGVANELGLTDTQMPSIGKSVWSGLGNKMPVTSIGPSTGNTVSNGTISPSGGGYETGGWSSGGGGASAAPAVPTPPEPSPPASSPPLDIGMYGNNGLIRQAYTTLQAKRQQRK